MLSELAKQVETGEPDSVDRRISGSRSPPGCPLGESSSACDNEDPASKVATAATAEPPLLRIRVRQFGVAMSNKNKGGREAKKPKAAHNVKTTGQTPPPGPIEAI